MKEFDNKVLNTIKKHNMIEFGDRIVVGLSGGADSCSLLLSLHNLAKELGITIVAAHLNHGIRSKAADEDMEFSVSFAKSLGIDCITKTVCVPQYAKENKISEETAGRKLRYEFFKSLCQKYNLNKIAVAHNVNDRAETIILNMLRGTGSNGIEGIKPVYNNIIRPVIECTREEIENYCYKNGVSFVTDCTNSQNIYARNIVRNCIIKEMSRINSAATENIIRFSDIMSDECSYLDAEAEKYSIKDDKTNDVVIEKEVFSSLHIALKRRIILNSVCHLQKTTQNISSAQIEALCHDVSTGSMYNIGDDIFVYITHDKIVFTLNNPKIPDYSYKINIPGKVVVNETNTTYFFELADKYKKEKDVLYLSLDNTNPENLVLRTKKDGDVFHPSGMKGSKKLKKFYIDSKISLHIKNLFPVIAGGEEILSVVPIRISEKHKVTNDTQKILKITKLGGTYDETN